MENEETNQEIVNLWKKYRKENQKGVENYPLLYPKFGVGCDILFVGINPSFPKKLEEEQNFKFENKSFDINKDINRERNAKNESSKNSYFKPIWKIVKELNPIKWEHIDMFLIRGTKQNKLKNYIGCKKEGDKLNKFGKAQFKLFKGIIKKINPKVLVIINAFASDIVKDKLEVDDSNFEKEGFYRISMKEGNIPLILSCYMGSGRLDKHSHKTLCWNIKRALKSVKETS